MGGKQSSLPINWPIFGMSPSLLSNLPCFADFIVYNLQQSHGTFLLKGPWFTRLELLTTADPNNVQYIMCKNHERFNRGANFEQIFEPLGDGIFNSDNDMWKYQRKIALACFTSMSFRRFMDRTIKYKVERGLIALLERSSMGGSEIDLQDVMDRLTGDITFLLLVGHDPNFLSYDPSPTDAIRCLSHEAADAALVRHVVPSCIWKLLRRLRIGKERKLCEFEEAIDSFIYAFIRSKREEVGKRNEQSSKDGDEHGVDLFSTYMEENHGTEDHGFKSGDIFLRDTFINFLFAGKGTVSATLTWFFWLIIKHPRVEAKIIEELTMHDFKLERDISQLSDPNKLVYLHAAIYETLRLYPPVPYNHRSPNKPETLPSGHRVKPSTMIILCTYAMGRMNWVWGDDCEEFKPERWITEEGKIRHEPSYKFFSFNSGPRICLGKEMSMMQLKAVVSVVLCQNYRFNLVEKHQVEPASAVLLRMKNGLKVRVTKHAQP